jgi:hypothetical protein
VASKNDFLAVINRKMSGIHECCRRSNQRNLRFYQGSIVLNQSTVSVFSFDIHNGLEPSNACAVGLGYRKECLVVDGAMQEA